MKKLVFLTLIAFVCIATINAQDEKKVELNLKIKDGASPEIYVDNKKFDFPLELIDTNTIAYIDVVKGKKAIEKYNSPNGVILITTKEYAKSKPQETILTIENYSDEKKHSETKIEIIADHPYPLIIIDDKEASQRDLKKLSPDDIDNISVLKDEAAKSLYDTENGVIIVKTIKYKRSKKK